MIRRTTLAMLIALAALSSVHADLDFSIRYQNKNIYYPGDNVYLKVSISNPDEPGAANGSFRLSEQAVESFGFDVRALNGEPRPSAEGFAAALNNPGGYRIMNLDRGQQLSMTLTLNDWINLDEPGQYRITGFFYPEGRQPDAGAIAADTVLNLTIMPDADRRWQDQLSEDMKKVLVNRDLSPRQVVEETLQHRSNRAYNRAMLYLDMEALALTSPAGMLPEEMEQQLLSGLWENLPGFEHPAISSQFISSRVYASEATVQMRVTFNPYGESFVRNLRFYLHKDKGYWAIRRVESAGSGSVSPMDYGAVLLTPPEVVSEMLQAASRGDWEIVLRYYDVTSAVRNLPEYAGQWKNMSAAEHRAALERYKRAIISGELTAEETPFSGIGEWQINQVTYSEYEGSVSVESGKTYETAAGPMKQKYRYVFYLSKSGEDFEYWQVKKYDVTILN